MGTYLHGPKYVFLDWRIASFLNRPACYGNGEKRIREKESVVDKRRRQEKSWGDNIIRAMNT